MVAGGRDEDTAGGRAGAGNVVELVRGHGQVGAAAVVGDPRPAVWGRAGVEEERAAGVAAVPPSAAGADELT